MLTCREIYGFLDDFLVGELDTATHVRFRAHLLLCAKCLKYLTTYRATINAAREAERMDAAESPPPPEELIQAILAAQRGDLATGAG